MFLQAACTTAGLAPLVNRVQCVNYNIKKDNCEIYRRKRFIFYQFWIGWRQTDKLRFSGSNIIFSAHFMYCLGDEPVMDESSGWFLAAFDASLF